jgi:hypothetical protein
MFMHRWTSTRLVRRDGADREEDVFEVAQGEKATEKGKAKDSKVKREQGGVVEEMKMEISRVVAEGKVE